MWNFDQDMRVLSFKKISKFSIFFPARIQDPFDFFLLLHGQSIPPYSICESTLILGGKTKP